MSSLLKSRHGDHLVLCRGDVFSVKSKKIFLVTSSLTGTELLRVTEEALCWLAR